MTKFYNKFIIYIFDFFEAADYMYFICHTYGILFILIIFSINMPRLRRYLLFQIYYIMEKPVRAEMFVDNNIPKELSPVGGEM